AIDLDPLTISYASVKTVDSLDDGVDGQDCTSLWSLLPDKNCNTSDEIVMRESAAIDVQRALSILTDKEKRILCEFYGLLEILPKRLDEIGMGLRLSGERVRQLKDQALKKIRHKISSTASNGMIPIQYCP